VIMNAFAKEAKKSDWHKHWHKPGRMREIRKNNTVVKLKKSSPEKFFFFHE